MALLGAHHIHHVSRVRVKVFDHPVGDTDVRIPSTTEERAGLICSSPKYTYGASSLAGSEELQPCTLHRVRKM